MARTHRTMFWRDHVQPSIALRRAFGALASALPALHAALLAAALCLCFDITAQAQPTLSLDDALQRAQQRSSQLSAQDSAAAAAREMAAAAGRLPDPVLQARHQQPADRAAPMRFSLTRDFMTMRSIGVMQEFTRDDKRKARAARFERRGRRRRGAPRGGARRRCAATRRWPGSTATTIERMRDLLNDTARRSAAADRGRRGRLPRRPRRAGRGVRGARRGGAARRPHRPGRSADRTAQDALARWVGATPRTQPLAAPPALTLDSTVMRRMSTRSSTQHPQLGVLRTPGGDGTRRSATSRAASRRPTGASS